MAQIQESGGSDHKGGKKRPKRGIPAVDMTPMVDLGFLLLTFFVMTSTFSKPKVMSLAYPSKEEKEPKPDEQLKVNNAITFLLSEDQVYYYKGQFYPEGNADGKPATQLIESNFGAGEDGVRKLLADENKYVISEKARLDNELKNNKIHDTTYNSRLKTVKGSKDALKVLVKTDDLAKAKNFIDMIDELRIADIGAFVPTDLNAKEYELLKAKTKKE